MQEERSVFWEIVPGERCNLSCLTCYAANGARPDRRVLDETEATLAVERLHALGVKKIDILGGEPLSCRFLERIAARFKRLNPEGFFGVVTNGTLLTKERAFSLRSAGVDQVSVSLDGITPATNDVNRGAGSFHRIVDGIRNAAAANLGITVSYTVTGLNLDEVQNFPDFAANLGAKSIGVQVAEPNGRGSLTWDTVGVPRTRGLAAITTMFYRKSRIFVAVSSRVRFKEYLNTFFNAGLPIEDERCGGGDHELMVTSGGDLAPCSLYLYAKSGRQRQTGVNLVRDDMTAVRDTVCSRYARFNSIMRTNATAKFSTCRTCEHHLVRCDPCPLDNGQGEVAECEWVARESETAAKSIMRSRIAIEILPVVSAGALLFSVDTQQSPIEVRISLDRFIQLIGSSHTGAEIAEYYASRRAGSRSEVQETVITFLAKLRSHGIVSLSEFPGPSAHILRDDVSKLGVDPNLNRPGLPGDLVT